MSAVSGLLWRKSAICAPTHLIFSCAVAQSANGFVWSVFVGAFAVQIALLLFIENAVTRAHAAPNKSSAAAAAAAAATETRQRRTQPPRAAKLKTQN